MGLRKSWRKLPSRGVEDLENMVIEFQRIAPDRVLGIQADVSDNKQVQSLIDQTEHRLGGRYSCERGGYSIPRWIFIGCR